ncbi:SWI5-dependent HO expression protein 3 [Striga asiatica]|uniref:SWI5-dependent HO expression protein 3 n=1 Tax=Striga asiatica TaxID=4170 RepID=A0A5A7QFI8_STRAF|nr:SWI5-dependent HO expression protein 3 [Striga asiatica]
MTPTVGQHSKSISAASNTSCPNSLVVIETFRVTVDKGNLAISHKLVQLRHKRGTNREVESERKPLPTRLAAVANRVGRWQMGGVSARSEVETVTVELTATGVKLGPWRWDWRLAAAGYEEQAENEGRQIVDSILLEYVIILLLLKIPLPKISINPLLCFSHRKSGAFRTRVTPGVSTWASSVLAARFSEFHRLEAVLPLAMKVLSSVIRVHRILAARMARWEVVVVVFSQRLGEPLALL